MRDKKEFTVEEYLELVEDELDVYDAVMITRELTAEELLRYMDLNYLRVYLYSRPRRRKLNN